MVFLLGYGLLALRRAVRPEVLEAAGTTTVSRRSVIVTTLALTYLNPGVYIDTVILLGSIANSRGSGSGQQWWFGAGAALGSVAWFVALGYGARLLTPVFARPNAWRVLDAAVAVIMATIAARLAFDW